MTANEATPTPNESTPAAGGNGKRKRVLLVIAGIFVVAGIAWTLAWLLVFSRREITDDAYVGGNQVIVSARVPGTVTAVMADDTDLVKAGQVLVRLDRTDAEVNLAKARSELARTVRQVRQMIASAQQADAAVAARRIELRLAQADLKRREPLLSEQAVAPEQLAHLRDRIKTARAQLTLAERQAAAAHAPVEGTDIQHNPSVQQAKAAFREAWLAAHRTDVLAPVSGYVAQRSVQVGASIRPGQPLMQVIPLHKLWIDANFKESQLKHIRMGQPVTMTSDLYGDGTTFHGKVIGLGAGTGAAFALLPPQNASGNWIKVVQRVPVRISLKASELDKHPLRIGLSMRVNVNTSHRGGRVLAQQPSTKAVAQTDIYANQLDRANRAAEAVLRSNLGKEGH